MPLIKEVFFRNKKKVISLFNKSEMIEKISKDFVTSSDRDSDVKMQKAVLKNLSWFQKINLADKEFFVEKSANPLKIKNQLVDSINEDGSDSFLLTAFVSLIPSAVIPVYIYSMIQNNINKQKVKKDQMVYLTSIRESMSLYAFLFFASNIAAIISLVAVGSIALYVGIVALNFLLIKLNVTHPYLNLENYELAEFRLAYDESNELSGIDSKIQNMESQDILIKNKKIEYDFLQEIGEEQQEIINLEKDNQKSVKHML